MVRLQWVARLDTKTCDTLPNGEPGCRSLNGQIYEVDDPTIKTPGGLGDDRTHPNCRCYIRIID